MPAISVIMPAYNCENTIENSIASLLGQDMQDFELIVADDASTDNSAALVEALACQDPRITLVKLEKNAGVGNARHVAVKHCTGKWITVLDADDWYAPERLSTLLSFVMQNDCDMLLDNLRIFDYAVSGIVDVTGFGKGNVPCVLDATMLFKQDTPLERYPIGYAKPMIKKSFLQEKGINYDHSYRVGEDFMLLTDVLLSKAKAYIIPYAGYIYLHRISPTSQSHAPSSKADSGMDNVMIRLCDDIAQKYYFTLTNREKTMLARKKRITLDWLHYMEFTQAVRVKNVKQVFMALCSHPGIIGFGILNMVRKIKSKAALKKFQGKNVTKDML